MMLVVVNSHNRPEALARCLKSLEQPTSEKVEILVSDSSDVTPDIPSGVWRRSFDPKIHPLEKINDTLEHIQGDRFWLLCDDFEVPEGCLDRAVKASKTLTDHQLGIFFWQNVFLQDGQEVTDGICHTGAGNLMATNLAFDLSGGWDTAFYWHHSDRDFRRRTTQAGMDTVPMYGVCVKHHFVQDAVRKSVSSYWEKDTELFKKRWPDHQEEPIVVCPVHHPQGLPEGKTLLFQEAA